MKTPQMKTNMKVLSATESIRSIALDADPDAIKEMGLERFGVLTNYGQYGYDSRFYLSVDGRYNFREVLEYVESLCVPNSSYNLDEVISYLEELKLKQDALRMATPITVTVIYGSG